MVTAATELLTAETRQALHAMASQLRATGGVVALCGFPASGKSTAAKYLAAQANAIVLDKDAFAPELEESVMGQLNGQPFDRDSELYRRIVSPYLYQALVTTGLRTAEFHPVVLEAPFLSHIRSAHQAGQSMAAWWAGLTRLATPVTTVWLDASPGEIRRRMTERAAARDEPKLANWSAYVTSVLESGLREAGLAVTDATISA